MSENKPPVKCKDIPLVKLVPIKKRTVTEHAMKKLRSTIEAVGLIEPLNVCPKDGTYEILDGYLRYKVLLELGVETVPCIIFKTRDIYTANRQVNHLSPIEETRMLRKAMEKVPEEKIAKTFGLKKINYKDQSRLISLLHPEVAKAYNDGKITRRCAEEISTVMPKRQLEILAVMQNIKKFDMSVVQSQILKTRQADRRSTKRKSPWTKNEERKKTLAAELVQIREEHDFYNTLYRQLQRDLMVLVMYFREIIMNKDLEQYLKTNAPTQYSQIIEIIKKNRM
jgi:Predicted transcriptional regulators